MCLLFQWKKSQLKNDIQVYLSGILANKDESIAILIENGREFKNKAVNKACDPG